MSTSADVGAKKSLAHGNKTKIERTPILSKNLIQLFLNPALRFGVTRRRHYSNANRRRSCIRSSSEHTPSQISRFVIGQFEIRLSFEEVFRKAIRNFFTPCLAYLE